MICNCLICCLLNFVNGMANEIALPGGIYLENIIHKCLYIYNVKVRNILKFLKKIRLCIYKIIV